MQPEDFKLCLTVQLVTLDLVLVNVILMSLSTLLNWAATLFIVQNR